MTMTLDEARAILADMLEEDENGKEILPIVKIAGGSGPPVYSFPGPMFLHELEAAIVWLKSQNEHAADTGKVHRRPGKPDD